MTNGTTWILLAIIVLLVATPPTWDPSIRLKWRMLGYPLKTWKPMRFEWWWTAGSLVVMAIIAALAWPFLR